MQNRKLKKSGLVFIPRQNDFVNEKSTSLIKELSLFSIKAKAACYGNGSSATPYFKSANKSQLYYLTHHQLHEYFVLEILNTLGINTPKTRIVNFTDKKKFGTVTKGFHNYIPICAIRPDCHLWNNNDELELITIKQRYSMDSTKQTIFDKKNNVAYKISGNLFTSGILGILVKDRDLQLRGNNLGLIKLNRRFYAIAIDKDGAKFDGDNYSTLLDELKIIADDPLFCSTQLDQVLEIVSKLSKMLIPDQSGKCDVDKIFFNPRVQATSCLHHNQLENYCQNFKKTAYTMIDYYKEKYGDNCLEKFNQREKIRETITKIVIERLHFFNSDVTPNDLARIIMGDLRAPYYLNSFKNGSIISQDDIENSELLAAITHAMENEFNSPIEESNELDENNNEENTKTPSDSEITLSILQVIDNLSNLMKDDKFSEKIFELIDRFIILLNEVSELAVLRELSSKEIEKIYKSCSALNEIFQSHRQNFESYKKYDDWANRRYPYILNNLENQVSKIKDYEGKREKVKKCIKAFLSSIEESYFTEESKDSLRNTLEHFGEKYWISKEEAYTLAVKDHAENKNWIKYGYRLKHPRILKYFADNFEKTKKIEIHTIVENIRKEINHPFHSIENELPLDKLQKIMDEARYSTSNHSSLIGLLFQFYLDEFNSQKAKETKLMMCIRQKLLHFYQHSDRDFFNNALFLIAIDERKMKNTKSFSPYTNENTVLIKSMNEELQKNPQLFIKVMNKTLRDLSEDNKEKIETRIYPL